MKKRTKPQNCSSSSEAPCVIDEDQSPMTAHDISQESGEATTWQPMIAAKVAETLGLVSHLKIGAAVGSAVGALLLAVVIPLYSAGFVNITKTSDVSAINLKLETVSKDVSSLKDDMAAVKTSVSEIKKASASPAPEHKRVPNPKVASVPVPPKSMFFGK